jgi:hypothetical protein
VQPTAAPSKVSHNPRAAARQQRLGAVCSGTPTTNTTVDDNNRQEQSNVQPKLQTRFRTSTDVAGVARRVSFKDATCSETSCQPSAVDTKLPTAVGPRAAQAAASRCSERASTGYKLRRPQQLVRTIWKEPWQRPKGDRAALAGWWSVRPQCHQAQVHVQQCPG